ncbi:MAG TPA: tripartite tricarboxylate transporter substrate-binding protein [Xanthobacteraceae bacterium]|jgi:tripartite-type tricarboxylate transporter receptor subunit TctC
MFGRWFFIAASLAAFIVASTIGVLAQAYPTGTVTFIEPFPVGGSIDVVMRAIAPRLQERFGKPFIVESHTGAGGVIATSLVAKASPDGHTLLAAASSLAANQELSKSSPYDTLRDLQAVSLVFRTPLLLVVNPKLEVKSIPDLIALLKQKPDQITFAHSGVGAAIHLAAELFQVMTGTKMIGVAYRGVQAAMTDVMEGRVDLMFADAGAVVGQVKSGTLRALGTTATTRIPAFPDVPAIAETVTGFDAVGWTLVCAPAATPKPIIDSLSVELAAAAEAPEVRDLILQLGNIPVKSPPPDELQKFLASEIKRWSVLIDAAGLAKTL